MSVDQYLLRRLGDGMGALPPMRLFLGKKIAIPRSCIAKMKLGVAL